MLESAGRARLAQQPFAHLVAVAAFANQFDRDVAADFRIQRPVEGAHATLPDFLEQLVVANLVGRPASHFARTCLVNSTALPARKPDSGERLRGILRGSVMANGLRLMAQYPG